jgi:hypothetical protein
LQNVTVVSTILMLTMGLTTTWKRNLMDKKRWPRPGEGLARRGGDASSGDPANQSLVQALTPIAASKPVAALAPATGGHWAPQVRAVAAAARRYGRYGSDNDAHFNVQGEARAAARDSAILGQLKNIKMKQVGIVDSMAITSDPLFSPDSIAANW